jgi:hypothetical protein
VKTEAAPESETPPESAVVVEEVSSEKEEPPAPARPETEPPPDIEAEIEAEEMEEAPKREVLDLDALERRDVFTDREWEILARFRELFSKAYRNIPVWVQGRTLTTDPERISGLLEEAKKRRDGGDEAGCREHLTRLYQEALDVKVRFGRTGRKVRQFLETIARRAGWVLGGKKIEKDDLEEGVMLIMSHEPALEECRQLMGGGADARERAPSFLASILMESSPAFRRRGE